MSTLALQTQFASRAFMASMAPTSNLGALILSANGFMALHADDPAKRIDSTVGQLCWASARVAGMQDVYERFVSRVDGSKLPGVQGLFQANASQVIGRHIRELAEQVEKGDAGIPVFRPKTFVLSFSRRPDVVSPGFRAAELKRLMDSGVADPADVQRLVQAIRENLEKNIAELYQVLQTMQKNRFPLALIPGSSSLVSMVCSGLSFIELGTAMANNGIWYGALVLMLGIVSYMTEPKAILPSDAAGLCKALGLTLIRHVGKIQKRLALMRQLLGEYEREFGHVDWTRVHAGRMAPATSPSTTASDGSTTPPAPASATAGPAPETASAPAAPEPSITEASGETFTPRATLAPEAGLSRLDRLEDQTGVKGWIRKTAAGVRVDAMRQAAKLRPETPLHAAFMGGEGTGRGPFAHVYAEALTEADKMRCTTGAPIIVDAASFRSSIDFVRFLNGKTQCVVLIRNAGKLDTDSVQSLLLIPKDSYRQFIYVLADDPKSLDQLFRSSPELARLVTHRVRFEDYDAPQLVRIMQGFADADGYRISDEGLRKALERLREKRGGAEIARELLAEAKMLQSARLDAEAQRGKKPTKEDLISLIAADFGTEAGAGASKAVEKLMRMTGIHRVKASIRELIALLETNREKEAHGIPVPKISLNVPFAGNQGTGKTTVARLYAEALRELGILPKGSSGEDNTGRTCWKCGRRG